MDRPSCLIHGDDRKHNIKKKALSNEGEMNVRNMVLSMNQSLNQVTFKKVSELAIKQWQLENPNGDPTHLFHASNGWVSNFLKRHDLSSQTISMRSSARGHKNPQDYQEVVLEYKTRFHNFIKENGRSHVYNIDETSFGGGSGMKTITTKNSLNQPRIINTLKGKSLSICPVITAMGERIGLFLNAKGKTARSLNKYGSYVNNNQCIMTCTDKRWFNESTILKVIEYIGLYSQGHKSMCILDAYKAHQTPAIIEKAHSLNIELLEVPKGLTADLQPLDYKVNGPFKNKMKTYWYGKNTIRMSIILVNISARPLSNHIVPYLHI